MNPMLDYVSIDDKTVASCEPNSLIAVFSAIKEIGYKMHKNTIKVRMVTVEASGSKQRVDAPKNYEREFKVGVGFHIKKVWHWAKVVIEYHYAPTSCMNTNIKSVIIEKQVRTGTDSDFEEVYRKG